MTDTKTAQGYNITVTPTERAQYKKTATGTSKVKFRATMTVRGREIERTVVAMGKSHDLLKGGVKKGVALAVRAIFDRAPANDDGKPGGEFLTVVGLPRAKAA